MKILTVSLIVAGLLATTGIASADRRRHDRRDRWEQRSEVRWHRPARRVFIQPVVRVAPPRVVVRHRHRVQPRVIVVQPAPPPPPVYVVQPYPPAPVYVPPPSDPNCDHDNYDNYDNGYQDYDGDGYDDDGYNNYSAPVQPSGVSAGVHVRVGS